MTMTTISDLPTDLLIDIVSRIPLKDMRAVRLACKTWNALSKSRSFRKMHIGKDKEEAARKGESPIIVLMDNNLYLKSVIINRTGVDPYTEPEVKGKLTCLNDSGQVRISQVFNCEGLLLCILKDDDTKIVVWNPYSGQTRWIETRYSYCGFHQMNKYSYALGYKNKKSCRNHQIFRVINKYHDPSDFVLCYEIYDFDSDLWTTLVATPHWLISSYQCGLSLKGNTYWLATKRNSRKSQIHHGYIICFDYTRERFGPLLPLPVSAEDASVDLSCTKEEKLAALYYHERGIDVWIATKIEARNISWSKFLTMPADIPSPYQGESCYIDEVKKIVMIFYFDKMWKRHTVTNINEETDGGYMIQVDLGDGQENCTPSVCSYVPSLVQIKQLRRDKRKKQQSSLEKCRYDRNMLRLVFVAEKRRKGDD